jgi:hypothetical protein
MCRIALNTHPCVHAAYTGRSSAGLLVRSRKPLAKRPPPLNSLGGIRQPEHLRCGSAQSPSDGHCLTNFIFLRSVDLLVAVASWLILFWRRRLFRSFRRSRLLRSRLFGCETRLEVLEVLTPSAYFLFKKGVSLLESICVQTFNC